MCPRPVFTGVGGRLGGAGSERGGSRPAGLKRFTVGCARVTHLTNTDPLDAMELCLPFTNPLEFLFLYKRYLD